jgi:site-specific DNA-methyltransferase (adenine-specific)
MKKKAINFEKISTDCQIINADAILALELIGDKTVDLILTDPPYNLGKFMEDRDTNLGKLRSNHFSATDWDHLNYDDWMFKMDEFLKNSSRVIKNGGAMIIFMSLIKVESIIHLAQKHDFYYKTTGIWHKKNPMPRNMNLHFINSTEGWIYFTYKKKTGTFNNQGKVVHDFFETSLTPGNEKRFGGHPTQKPESIIKHFVTLLTNKGDTILDPFMGSGTTGKASLDLGRKFIGIELSQKYYGVVKNRILEPKLF